MCRAIEEMCRQAFEQGREQGMREIVLRMAENMLEDGLLTLEEIMKVTGLSLDEIKKLQGKLSPGT